MAYSYQVPVSYTINVSLAMTPTGLANYNTNSIAIFSNEAAGFTEPYQAYITPSAVASDFGSNSLTYQMANALFTPVPNFRTGGGYLYIFPFNGVDATAGSFTTTNISANLTAFKSVEDGSLKITIDGTAYTVSGLNFTNVKSIADIVSVLNGKNLDVYIEAVGNTIKFTSKRYGADASVAINTITAGGVVDISAAAYLDASNGTTVNGANASGQTLAEAVAAAQEKVYFGASITCAP